MSRALSRRRRVHNDLIEVVPIAVIAGVAAALAGARPTGQLVIDLVLVGLAVAVTTWVAATAPWWVLVVGAGVVGTTAQDPTSVALAVVALLLAGWVGIRRRSLSGARAASAGLVLNAAARSEFDWFFGSSAVIAIGVAVLFLIAGALRQRSRLRRITVLIGATTAVIAGVGTITFAAAALSTRNALEDSIANTRHAVSQLTAGELDAGRESLDAARRGLIRSQSTLAAPWTAAARVVPVVAQHRQATAVATTAALEAVEVLEAQLDQVDLGALRPVEGRIDLEQIDRIDDALAAIDDALDTLEKTAQANRSPWLLASVQRRIDGLTDELAASRARSDQVREVVDLLPGFLGANGERRYLIVFTTPAEARGHGGFMGNFAEITANDGQLTMSRFGRTGELNAGGSGPRRFDAAATGLGEWLTNYGRFGFDNAEGDTVGNVPWSNITIGSNFPDTAAAIAALYPQSGGRPIDGVFAVDIDTVAAMINFTGPIELADLDEPLTAANAAEFLLYDQYRAFEQSDRVDLLETVSEIVLDQLLDGALPTPTVLVDTLSPRVNEGRLTAWSRDADEQALFDRFGMTHRLIAGQRNENGSLVVDSVAVSFTNSTGSKLELFLDAELDYTLEIDPIGVGRGTVTVTMANNAPTSDWPEGVIGNTIGLPIGTNRLMVSLYASNPWGRATLDGAPIAVELGDEADLFFARAFVTLAPGERRVLSVDVTGWYPADPLGPEAVLVRTPAAVRPIPATITVTNPAGTITQRTTTPGTHRIDLR